MSMLAKHVKALEMCQVALVRDLNPNDVIDHLIADQVLVPDDIDSLDSHSGKDKVRLLLSLIKRRGDRAFYSFIKGLGDGNSGHSHLHDLVLQKLQETESVDMSGTGSSMQQGVQCTQPHSMNSPDARVAPAPSLNQSSVRGYDFAQSLRETPLHPNMIPSDKLLGQLASKLGSNWEELASQLGLGPNVVYRCKQENQLNLWAQVYSMLIAWRNKEYKNATIGRLVQELKALEDSNPADYSCLMDA